MPRPLPAMGLVAQARYLVTHIDEYANTDRDELTELRHTAWSVLADDLRRRKARQRITFRPCGTGGVA